jgi:hypothetical protein
MKKIIFLSVVVLLLIASTASIPLPTITIAPDGLSFTISNPYYYSVKYKVTFCDGTEQEGTIVFNPSFSITIDLDKPISHVEAQYLVENDSPNGYKAVASRTCEAADPLFMMWLLTRGDQGCILLSETHPSVERQRALCFPATDPDWTADNAPCADYVYDNDTWSCDAFGFPRLPLYDETGPDLMQVWQRHAARQQE